MLVELNDDTKINIEPQMAFSCFSLHKQIHQYLSKMFTEDLKVGDDYAKLKRCISISKKCHHNVLLVKALMLAEKEKKNRPQEEPSQC